MINFKKIFFIVLFSLVLGLHLFSQESEKKRWPIKTLTDKDTTLINFKNIVKSSVHDQINIKRPAVKFLKRDASETTVYSIDCYVVGFKREKDTDIHVIIKDVKTGETMVAEIVSPKGPVVKYTSRHKEFKKLRKWFVNNIGKPKYSFTMFKTPKLVTITGVGFWDTEHGQRGMALNGREIHPILSMKFKD